MIKNYGRNLILKRPDGLPIATVRLLPAGVLDAINTLFVTWPDLVSGLGPVDLPSNCFDLTRSSGALKISLKPSICDEHGVEGLPIHIAARFERMGDFLSSFSELIRLQSVQAQQGDIPTLKFQVENMGATIGEVIDLLVLKGRHTQHSALQLCLQLVFVFRIRTVGQLVLWLNQVLNPDAQLVTDEHTKAMIDTFWHWSTPNFLFLIYEVLAHQGIQLSDPAFFLYYTKLTTMLEDDAKLTSDKVDVAMRGRLKLPMVPTVTPNIVPKRWLNKLARQAEAVRERMGAELISSQTEPTLWTSGE